IHALAVSLLGLQPKPQLLAHHGRKEAAHRVRLPASGAHDGGDCGAVRSAQQRKHPRLLRIRSRWVMADLAAGRLRTYLGCRPCLTGPRRFALGHTTLLSIVPAQLRAATTQTPRRPIGAGGARGASRSGSMSLITTHALFARKVQRKLSNGIAGLAADGASLDPQKSQANSRLTAMPLDGQRRPITLAEERHFPSGAAQTRIVSASPSAARSPPSNARSLCGIRLYG